MQINLYTNIDERTRVVKNLLNEKILTGTFRDSVDVLHPVVLLTTVESILDFNYAYIPEFSRYYYVDGISLVRTGLYALTLSVDVLMSFADAILDLECIVSDSEKQGDDYLSSAVWKSKVKTKTDIINFSTGLSTDGNFVLITAGGIPAV